MTAEAHVEAVKTLIGASVRLYEGRAPDGAVLPYAVLYANNGRASRTALASVSDRRDHRFQITSVALDDDGVRSVADRVMAAVLDRRPVVAGRQTSPITHELSQPLRIDRDGTPHRLFVVDEFAFSSVPTS